MKWLFPFIVAILFASHFISAQVSIEDIRLLKSHGVKEDKILDALKKQGVVDITAENYFQLKQMGFSEEFLKEFLFLFEKPNFPELPPTILRSYQRAPVQSPINNVWALIVGVNNYQQNKVLPDLKFAIKDAESFARHLLSIGVPPKQICLLTEQNATAKNLAKMVHKIVNTSGTVYFFYSGHGLYSDKSGFYFACHDTATKDLEDTAYSMNQLKRHFDSMTSQRLILFLDACHSGAVKEAQVEFYEEEEKISVGRMDQKMQSKVKELSKTNQQIAVITSCREDQVSREGQNGGLFTELLLEGLSGKADRDKDHNINVKELFLYLNSYLPDKTELAQMPDCRLSRSWTSDAGLPTESFSEGTRKLQTVEVVTPPELSTESYFEVSSTTWQLQIAGRINGGAPVTKVLLNRREILWQSQDQRFIGDLYLKYGKNMVELAILNSEGKWSMRNWVIYRKSQDEAVTQNTLAQKSTPKQEKPINLTFAGNDKTDKIDKTKPKTPVGSDILDEEFSGGEDLIDHDSDYLGSNEKTHTKSPLDDEVLDEDFAIQDSDSFGLEDDTYKMPGKNSVDQDYFQPKSKNDTTIPRDLANSKNQKELADLENMVDDELDPIKKLSSMVEDIQKVPVEKDLKNGQEIESFLDKTDEILKETYKNPVQNNDTLKNDNKITIIESQVPLQPFRKFVKFQQFSYNASEISCLALSPNGQILASSDQSTTIRLFDMRAEKIKHVLSGHSLVVKSIAFSSDGKYLASGSWDKSVIIWNIETGEKVLSLTGHREPVSCVSFSPDDKYLASGSWDRTIKIWDVTTGQQYREFRGHVHWVNSIAYSPDGKRIISGSEDKTARIWSIADDREEQTISEHIQPIYNVRYSSKGKAFAISSGNLVTIWSNTGKYLHILKNEAWIQALQFSPDGQTIATGDKNGNIVFWQWEKREKLQEVSAHKQPVISLNYSANGNFLLSGSNDQKIKLWKEEDAK